METRTHLREKIKFPCRILEWKTTTLNRNLGNGMGEAFNSHLGRQANLWFQRAQLRTRSNLGREEGEGGRRIRYPLQGDGGLEFGSCFRLLDFCFHSLVSDKFADELLTVMLLLNIDDFSEVPVRMKFLFSLHSLHRVMGPTQHSANSYCSK